MNCKNKWASKMLIIGPKLFSQYYPAAQIIINMPQDPLEILFAVISTHCKSIVLSPVTKFKPSSLPHFILQSPCSNAKLHIINSENTSMKMVSINHIFSGRQKKLMSRNNQLYQFFIAKISFVALGKVFFRHLLYWQQSPFDN